jgi:hypothetical protein
VDQKQIKKGSLELPFSPLGERISKPGIQFNGLCPRVSKLASSFFT